MKKKRLIAYAQAMEKSCMISKTDTNGIITYVNDMFCESIGYTREELLGKSHALIRHKETTQEEYKELWETLLAKKVFKKIFKNKTKEKKTIYYQTTLLPIMNKKNKIKEFLALRYDVSSEMKVMKDLKETMQTLLQKEQLLMHQSKLIQMGELIGLISHQWRQPLSAISATTIDLDIKLVLGNFDKDHFSHKLKNISEYTEYLSNTIDDFRNFFKQDNHKEITNYENIVKAVLSIISMSLKNNVITLKIQYQSKRPINVFVSELQQVILNSIRNAQEVLLERKIQTPCIAIKTFSNGENEVIEISDNGGGIQEELLQKIFVRHISKKKIETMFGLSLYMSRVIVEEHFNGEIKVFNRDQGMVVHISIPYVQ